MRPTTPAIGGKPRSPEAIAQDHHAAAALGIFFGREGAADRRRDAHHLEKRRGHANTEERHRLAAARQVDAFVVNHRRQGVEGAVAPLPFRELVSADDVLRGVRARFPDERDAIGLAEGQRSQQHGVDDAEDHGRAADRQREERDDRERQRRRPPDAPPRVAGILKIVFEPSGSALVSASFFQALEPAEGEARLTPGFGRRQSLALQRFRLTFEVRLDLGLHLTIEVGAPDERPEAIPEVVPQLGSMAPTC